VLGLLVADLLLRLAQAEMRERETNQCCRQRPSQHNKTVPHRFASRDHFADIAPLSNPTITGHPARSIRDNHRAFR
jgi:hypothetical protein